MVLDLLHDGIELVRVTSGDTMSIAKIIEVKAEGASLDAALQNAATEASRSIDGIRSVYMKDAEAVVEDGRIDRYRVNAKVTFVVDPSET
jgi:hypothetical protein